MIVFEIAITKACACTIGVDPNLYTKFPRTSDALRGGCAIVTGIAASADTDYL